MNAAGSAPVEADSQSRIGRGRLERVTLCQVSKPQLSIPKRGSPGSIYLNVAIVLLPSGVLFPPAFMGATIPSDRTFLTVLALTAVGYLARLLLLALWQRDGAYMSALAKKHGMPLHTGARR